MSALDPPLTSAIGPHAQCHVCNLVVGVPEGSTDGLACPRCRTALHRRKPKSLSRTWALLIAAAICYVPANLYPVMEVTTLGVSQADTILSLNGQGLYDGNRELVGGVVTFRDITDISKKTSELEKLAQYDELTTLPNRSLFTEQLARAIGRAQRKKAPLAVLFVDLDRFKSVNDTLGHDIGDSLLRQIAGRLRSNLRIGDFSGRWGGDEFVVCLEDFGESGNAAAAAQKLLLVLSEKYEIGNSEVYATPSIGIAIYPESGESADRLPRGPRS